LAEVEEKAPPSRSRPGVNANRGQDTQIRLRIYRPGHSPPYCGVGCELTVHAQEGQIVKVSSPLDHSVTQGNLCIRGRSGWQFTQTREKCSGTE